MWLGLLLSTAWAQGLPRNQVLESFALCHERITKDFLAGGAIVSCAVPSEVDAARATAYQSLLTPGANLQEVQSRYEEIKQEVYEEQQELHEALTSLSLLHWLQTLTERISVQSLFVYLNVNRSHYASELRRNLKLWTSDYEMVMSGNLHLGLRGLSQQCPLQYMRTLSLSWEHFSLAIGKKIISTDAASSGTSIAELKETGALQEALQGARTSLEQGSLYSCNNLDMITKDDWFSALKDLNQLRKMLQMAVYHFFELVMVLHEEDDLKAVTEKLKEDVVHDLWDAAQAIEHSIRGSAEHPVFPSQEILDDLFVAQRQLQSLSETIRLAVRAESFHEEMVTALEEDTNQLDDALDHLASKAIVLAKSLGVLGVIEEYFADRQVVYLYEMIRESLCMHLSNSSANGSAGRAYRFEGYASTFEDVHKLLTQGGRESEYDITLQRTTDACIIWELASVLKDYGRYKGTMIQLFSYQDSVKQQLAYMAEDAKRPGLQEAFKAFKSGWASYAPSDLQRNAGLLKAYHFSNPNAAGSKDQLDYASGPEDYHAVHGKYHPEYRGLLYARNYYDIFFFDLDGNCIYSVYKELDFATNFGPNGTGPYKDSGLGLAFQAALREPASIHETAWMPYAPSAGALASFRCTGVSEEVLLGVFCTQMPQEAQPVTLQGIEEDLSKVTEKMTLCSKHLREHQECDMQVGPKGWEILVSSMALLEYQTYRAETEQVLLSSGYSELWLEQAAEGHAAQKASIMACVTSELASAMVSFRAAWETYRPTDEERLLSLQIAYILLNPYPTGEKDKLDVAAGAEMYHTVHQKFHPTYRALLYERNYYDIFFFDLNGNCIYSVYKELDFATNFAKEGNGEWRDSGLGEAYRAGLLRPGVVNLVDWTPYGPSKGALASFLSIGVLRGEDLVGVFCTQLPPTLKPRNSSRFLEETIEELSTTFFKLRYGSLEEDIYPPPTQGIADELIEANDLWERLEPLLGNSSSKDVSAETLDLLKSSAHLSKVVVDAAWLAQPDVEGAKIQLASSSLALLQRLTRDAVRWSVNGRGAAIQVEMARLEQNMEVLRHGPGRRLAQEVSMDSIEGLKLLSKAEDAWAELKGSLTGLFDLSPVPESALKEYMDLAAVAEEKMQDLLQFVSTTTRTTTLVVLDVLTPVPLTGSWPAGQTFRTALKLAEALINEDQYILPGYELRHTILDDECDGSRGADVVVSANVEMGGYVALGGMGCDSVCQQVSTLSVSLKLPFLAFDCPSSAFSNVAAFPALSRLGTPLEPFPRIIERLRARHGWSKAFLITGDPSVYGTEATGYAEKLQESGMQVTQMSALEHRWVDIESLMANIKAQSTGEQRVLFVLGDETYIRRLLCASITAQLEKGITWISVGSRRHEWWKRSDQLTSFHRHWVWEMARSMQLRAAFTALRKGWEEFNTSSRSLRDLYVTLQQDALIRADGPESYHAAHGEYHPQLRSLLYQRSYYDIFLFDLTGTMIYSVAKEADYGTSFGAESSGPWKASGLGSAVRAALAEPDEISFADWAAYGPSGAQAAFLATGIRDTAGGLMGVYAIQLPDSYQKSIEEEQPLCSLQAMAAAYEGAINIVGSGQPMESEMEKPLACFKGHSPRSMLSLIDKHLARGYPEGDETTIVRDPYNEVKANAVDGACTFALAIQNLLKNGYNVERIRRKDAEVYQRFQDFIRTELNFLGVSGRVRFDGNDRANPIIVQQVVNGSAVKVAVVEPEGSFTWIDGMRTLEDAWSVEPVVPFQEVWILQVLVISVSICCPICFGMLMGFRIVKRRREAASNQAGEPQV